MEDIEEKEEPEPEQPRPEPRRAGRTIPTETIKRVRELYMQGYKPPQIAGMLNIGINTAYKYTRDISTPTQMSRVGGGINLAEREVARQVEYDITRKAIHETEDIYNLGSLIKEVIKPMAESYGLEIRKFVEMCVEFWDEYHNSVYDWKRENDVLKALLEQLLEETEPQAIEIMRKKLIANYLFQISVYLPMLGITPTQEMLLNYAGAIKELI